MMKIQMLMTTLVCTLGLSSMSFANDKVESTYNAKQYQKVCKGKSEGAEVSFAYRGIIWNGTCQTQFFPSNTKGLKGDEAELRTACQTDAAAKTATIAGQEHKGKCALGYAPPMPKS